MRLGRDGDRLVVGRRIGGRGAWVCAGADACFERALDERLLSRALRHAPLLVIDEAALHQAFEAGHGPGKGVGG